MLGTTPGLAAPGDDGVARDILSYSLCRDCQPTDRYIIAPVPITDIHGVQDLNNCLFLGVGQEIEAENEFVFLIAQKLAGFQGK